jgi:protein-disulfide isomerase
MSAAASKVSWIVALAVGVVLGVSADRMVGGNPRSAAPAARPAPLRPPPAAPPIEDTRAVYRVPVDDAPLRGPADALVTIVVASDFQCPFCKRVEPTLQALADAYPGKIRFAWRHAPLPGHPRAIPAAVAAEEVRALGGDAKFWAMHDALFESAPALEDADLVRAAEKAGVDGEKVRAAIAAGKHADRIRSDQAAMQAVGVNGTPTMFVNGRKVVGALPLEQFRPVVDEELKKAEALVASGTPAAQVYARIMEKGARAPVFLGGGTPTAVQPTAAAPQPQGAPAAPPATAAKVPLRADDPSRGPADAKVTIAVFSDFQCPFCARVEPTIAQIERTWPGQVRVVWKHQPLPFHPNARPAALAAEAAREQGKFWEMHDRMFAGQSQLSAAQYGAWAKEIGLDLAKFQRSLVAPQGAKRVDEDQALAGRVGADGTPTLFLNCRKVAGAYPFESFKPVVEEELRKAEALARAGKSGAALYEAACDDNVKAYPAQQAAAAPPAAAPLPGGRAAVPVRADDPAKGKASAPVTMVLFSDFQCPFCARATPAVADVERSYPDDVRIVWKHFPLPFHPNAMPAALAAEAARQQGGAPKFWAMHDKLFANQAALSDATYQAYARELGLDLARFKRDLADPKLKARVEEDMKLAQQLGVNGTPTFIVNGERVVGANGLKPAVERVLAQAKLANAK